MPVASRPLSDAGAVVDLLVGVSENRRAVLARNNLPLPERARLIAQVDTGSSVTVIQPDLLSPLGIDPIDEVALHTPSTGPTPFRCPRYHVSVSLLHEHLEL